MASDIIGTGLVTSDDKVIGIECLPEMNLVAIATRNGEFLSCNSITVEVSDWLFMRCMVISGLRPFYLGGERGQRLQWVPMYVMES